MLCVGRRPVIPGAGGEEIARLFVKFVVKFVVKFFFARWLVVARLCLFATHTHPFGVAAPPRFLFELAFDVMKQTQGGG